jgi:plastocyanin
MTGFQKELCRAQSQGSEQMIRLKHPWIAMAMLAIMLSGSNQARSAEVIVRIANFTFDPPLLTVQVGSTVRWKNVDDIVHVVKEKDGAFHSDPLDTDQTFSQTFARAGTIDYFCAIHPHMTGRIVVKP